MPRSRYNQGTRWLPEGKRAAVVFTIDDVHPASSQAHGYDAGGDGENGVLGHLAWLLERHPALHTTLFVPADWRETSPFPTRELLSHIPVLRHRLYQTRRLSKGTMRLDRHPRFLETLRSLPRTDIALHGLHHVGPGASVTAEFSTRNRRRCRGALQAAISIFRQSELPLAAGLCPPGWIASGALQAAMADVGLRYLASARDVITPVAPDAKTAMSGLCGVPLVQPTTVAGGKLVHLTSNFSANNAIERAFEIVEANGLLAVKAHILKRYHGHLAVDGLDLEYRDYLHHVFSQLHRKYGESLWWTSMNGVTERYRSACALAEVNGTQSAETQRVG